MEFFAKHLQLREAAFGIGGRGRVDSEYKDGEITLNVILQDARLSASYLLVRARWDRSILRARSKPDKLSYLHSTFSLWSLEDAKVTLAMSISMLMLCQSWKPRIGRLSRDLGLAYPILSLSSYRHLSCPYTRQQPTSTRIHMYLIGWEHLMSVQRMILGIIT